MRTWFLLLVLVLGSFQRASAQTEGSAPGYEAIATIHIDALDEAKWQKLAAYIGKDDNTDAEYSCVKTGVVVIRIQHMSVGEKADVVTYVRRMLGEAGIGGAVEFLNIHVEQQGPGKC